jgi:oxygen-independent coproporphyrinogen-3 oxidase
MSMLAAAAHETIDLVNAGMDSALGLYVSIPFCRSKCTYCNFASGVYPASQHARYVERVIEDLRAARRWAAQAGVGLPRRVDTIYLGGGTPNLLAAELVGNLFAAIRAEFDVDPDAEITMECAPGQFATGTLEAMAAAQVNRVSLGVQSFVDSETRMSGRLHTRAVIEEDLRRLRAIGIANLNIDLIAGLADQTYDSWDASLAALTGAGVPHASVYMLEVDEDSRLGRELIAGGTRYHAGAVPTDDAIARMYERALEKLDAAGLEQYEISNFRRRGFSRPGFASRHNLRYWQRRPYLGVGLDASSALRAKDWEGSEPRPILRAKTPDDLAAYLAGPQPPETAWLSRDQQHEEAWFLGLRLNAGVDVAALEEEFGSEKTEPALAVVERLVEDNLLVFDGKRARLTARGRMISNDVFQEFLGLGAEVAIPLERDLTSTIRIS